MRFKKTTLALVFFVFIIALTLSAAAYYRDDYWECTSEGEASQGDAYGRRIGDICQSSCCKLCISPSPYWDCWSSEAQPSCQCTGGSPNDFEPPVITILSPSAIVYSYDDILINIQTNEIASIKRRIDNEDMRGMCSSCTSAQYLKSNLDDGQHVLYIEASDQHNNKANATVYFTIDSEPPVITSTLPIDGSYINNSNIQFTANYDENNLVSVILYYKASYEPSYNSASLAGCQSGISKSCSKPVNLNQYPDGTAINYYFSISDAASTTSSSAATLTIDNFKSTLPFIINDPVNNTIYGTKNVPFDLSTAGTSDFYYSTDNIKFKKLCSNCKTYDKNVSSIKDGIYDMIIRKIDSNGNNYDRYVHIRKDTVKPKIKSRTPGNNDDVGQGTFTVKYAENYLKEISLYYGPTGTENAITKTDCASGKDATCTFENVDIEQYNGQQIKYFFEVKDYVATTNSKVYSINIDTEDPVVSITDPSNYGLYDSSIVFGIQVSEPVKLEMSDNGGRFSKLCTECTEYSRKKSFNNGEHILVVRATDLAGNIDEETISTTIF